MFILFFNFGHEVLKHVYDKNEFTKIYFHNLYIFWPNITKCETKCFFKKILESINCLIKSPRLLFIILSPTTLWPIHPIRLDLYCKLRFAGIGGVRTQEGLCRGWTGTDPEREQGCSDSGCGSGNWCCWTNCKFWRLRVRALAQAIGSSHGSDLDATNACGYVWRLQVRGLKWLGCHAGHQEVGRCRTRGESEE